jgi:hypothetical protein
MEAKGVGTDRPVVVSRSLLSLAAACGADEHRTTLAALVLPRA